MTSRQLLARWREAGYLASVKPVLDSIRARRQYSGLVDLRGLVVGLDDELPNLEPLDFQDTELEEVDLSHSRFSCSFSRCVFTSCQLEMARFDTCRMVSSTFRRTNFAGGRISAPMLNDASFGDCRLARTILRGRGTKAYGARRAEFVGCSFDEARFVEVELRACRFVDCSFEGVLFQRCLLVGVKFEGNGPEERQFKECTLRSTRLTSRADEL